MVGTNCDEIMHWDLLRDCPEGPNEWKDSGD